MKRPDVLLKAVLTTSLIFGLTSSVALAKTGLSCQAVLSKQKSLVTEDLLAFQAKETKWLFPFQVESRNQETIRELKGLPIERRTQTRTPNITREDAQLMIDSIEQNPVTTGYQYRFYSPPGREIGFCFGRAMYIHLLALHLGVQKDAIKKAWVVGPMKSGGINWSFHVATIIKSGDQWLAVDNFPGKLLTIEEWLKHMQPMSTDKKLRLYITDADKFAVGPYRYDKIQMNHYGKYGSENELPREQDWYSGFFSDLLTWFHDPDMSTVGLPTPEEFKKAHMPPVAQVPTLPENEIEAGE